MTLPNNYASPASYLGAAPLALHAVIHTPQAQSVGETGGMGGIPLRNLDRHGKRITKMAKVSFNGLHLRVVNIRLGFCDCETLITYSPHRFQCSKLTLLA